MDIYTKDAINKKLTKKQDTLVSGTNIKTINGNSLLGSGDVAISGGSGSGTQGDKLVRLYIDNIKGETVGSNNTLVFVGYRNEINTALQYLGLDLETLSSNWKTLMTGENATKIWGGLCYLLSLGYCFSCFFTTNDGSTVSPIIGYGYLEFVDTINKTPKGERVFNGGNDALNVAFADSTMTIDNMLER